MTIKCLLTGASGLIGSHLLPELLREWEVHTLGRHQPSLIGHDHLHWYPVNFMAPWDIKMLPPQIDAVIYLSQSEHFRDFPEKALDIFTVNTAQVAHLLDYAKKAGVTTFIFASSGGVYGSGDLAFSENTHILANGNLGYYLSTKLCSEILVENYQSFMTIITLRFFFVYGTGQKRSMLIPRMIDNVREGKPITLQGSDGILINPTHVSDAVTAIKSALKLRVSDRINVGGPSILSLREIGEIIGKILGKEPIFHLQTNVKPKHIIGDITKMTSLLIKPVISFQQGVKTLI